MNNIANLPDMLGWHIGNPLGLGSIAMLLIILVLVETMSVFDYFIRHRDKPQFYPVLYTLFGVSLLAVSKWLAFFILKKILFTPLYS